MHLTFMRFGCSIVLSLFVAGVAFAQGQPAEVSRGLSWLAAQVAPDGRLTSEAQSIATALQSRTEAANTLRLLATPSTPLDGILTSNTVEGTEDLARKLIHVARSGGTVAGLTADLLSRQNFDGGFVPMVGAASNAYDTAWALVALAAAGVASGAESNRARAFLKQAQQTDGGIGLSTEVARIVETSIALEAFRTSNELTYATARASAASFLKSKQLPDGSWRGDIYLTASTFNALASEGLSSTERERVYVWLRGTQSLDGSWAADPFLTAISVRALSGVLPVSPLASSLAGRIIESDSSSPVSGVAITLTGSSPAVSTISSSNGTFALTSLLPGIYSFAAAKAGYQTFKATATVGASEQIQVGDIEIAITANSGVVRGRVLAAAGGLPISGAIVATDGSPSLTATTGVDGRYEVVGVPTGAIRLTTSKDGFASTVGSTTIIGGKSVDYSTSLYATGVIPPTQGQLFGRVVAAGTGLSLGGVQISIVGAVSVSVATAGDGSFASPLPSGSYTATFSIAGYRALSRIYVVTNGAAIDAGRIELDIARLTTRIIGKVTQIDGTAIAGASVSLQGGPTQLTNGAGQYAFDDLAGQSFVLNASATGVLAQSVTRQVTEPTELTQDFVLVPRSKVSVLFGPLTVAPSTGGANVDFVVSTSASQSSGSSALLSFELQLLNTANEVIATGLLVDTVGQPLGSIQLASGTPASLRAIWNSGRFAAGTYTARIRALVGRLAGAPYGETTVLGESTASLTILPDRLIAGSITADPPVARAGTTAPIKLTAVVQNAGNVLLASGGYRLRILNAQTNAEAYNQAVTATSIAQGAFVTLTYPEWVPTVAASYRLLLIGPDGVRGQIENTLFVGDSPTATYTLNKTVVPTGNQTVRATIELNGVDPINGTLGDPLAPLLKSAIRRAVKYNDDTSRNFTLVNRCAGCHVQSQAIASGEVNRDVAPYDDLQRAVNVNALMLYQKEGGHVGGWNPYPGQPMDNMLGLWSLTFHHAKDKFARVLKNATDFALSLQESTTGRWPSPIEVGSFRSGWWASDYSFSGFNLRSLIETHGVLRSLPPSAVKTYALNTFVNAPNLPTNRSLAIDRAGNFYMGQDNNAIQLVRPDGTLGPRWTVPSFVAGMIEAADGNGMLISLTNGIFRLLPNGSVSTTAIAPVPGPARLSYGPDGVLWAGSYFTNQLWRIAPDLTSQLWYSGAPLNGPARPYALPNGDVLVPNYLGTTIVRINANRTATVVMPFTNGRPLDLIQAPDKNGLYLSTESGLFNVFDDFTAIPLLPDRAIDEMVVRPDGRIFAVRYTFTGIHEIVGTNYNKDATLATYAAAIERGTNWLLTQTDTANKIPLPQAHQMIGLEAARKYYAGQPRADAITAKMQAIGAELLKRQNADGGWGYRWYGVGNSANMPSESLVTAQVSYALDALDPSASSPTVRKTINLLLSRQLGDGSWRSETVMIESNKSPTTWITLWLRKMLDRMGSIDTDLTLAFAPNVQPGNVAPAATSVQTLPSGETIYNWKFTGVTVGGRSISFDAGLQGMVPNEKRSVSTESFLAFRNSFNAETIKFSVPSPVVQADDGVDLVFTSDRPAYTSNSTAQFNTALTNRLGSPASGTLRVTVFDSAGALVSQIASGVVSIPANNTISVPSSFAVGTILAGQYSAKAELTDNAGRLLAQGLVTFDVLADQAALSGRVVTDKSTYQSRDLVTINGRVYNRAVNFVLNDYVVRETVLDTAGAAIFTASRAFRQIGPASFADAQFSFRLSNVPAGNYSVRQDILDALGAVQQTQTAAFVVQASNLTGASLRGMISAAPRALQRGGRFAFDYSLNNLGNSGYTSLPVKINVIDPVNAAVVASSTTTISLPQLATAQAASEWNTSGTPVATGASGLSNYVVALIANVGGTDQVLSQETLLVGDLKPFAFTPRIDLMPNASVTSNPATLIGLAVPVPIAIQGGEYRVNGGAFTSQPGTVRNGDIVEVRTAASAMFSTKRSATLTVDILSASFDVTTLAADLTPDPFSFAPQLDVATNATITSNSITITGINTVVAVSAQNGTLSVNGGPYNAVGEARSGDIITLRQVSSALFSTKTTATLTVGSVSGSFDVTTIAADITPNSFAFAPQINLPISTAVASNTVTITGINTDAPISVTGGQYRVNGGAYTSAAGTVRNSDTVTVQQTSSAQFNTKTTATLNVGGVTGAFDVTTSQAITTPTAFSFTPITGVALNSVQTSNTITVGGINTTVPISVSGGLYSINGGPYTNAAGTVKAMDTVAVRQTASSLFNTKTTASLTISTTSAGFDVTTLQSEGAPTYCVATPTVADATSSASFAAYSTNERLEIRSGRPAGADWEWGLGTNTQNAASFQNINNIDWPNGNVGGLPIKFTLTYNANGGGVITLFNSSTNAQLATRTFAAPTAPATGLRVGNAVQIWVKTNAGIGVGAKVKGVIREIDGLVLATPITLETAGNNNYSDQTVVVALAQPATAGTLVVKGEMQLSWPGAASAIPTGSRLNATITAGNVSCGNFPPLNKSSAFSVHSAAANGADITGSIAVAPKEVLQGDAAAFTYRITNAGNADVMGIPVRVQLQDAAGQVVATLTKATDLPRGTSIHDSQSWPVPIVLSSGEYKARIEIALGTAAITLADTAFKVKPRSAIGGSSVEATPSENQLLVLVSCPSENQSSDGNKIDASGCIDHRIAFVQQYLASLGIEHFAVVASIDEFRDLLRGGDYNTYWISGGAVGLDGELSKEIRRAVFGGDALMVDGQPETRTNAFDDIVGITNKGWQIASAQTVSLTNSEVLMGEVPSLGRGLRVELHSGA
ncbi:MAG: carboxypeptidase regulatory-like domain-containing protein, partial [Rhodocyclaceae bacterium]|nr:carboxypeptidase regulatory-like domain-containing protein [Rhodocyclaceae bacterium]